MFPTLCLVWRYQVQAKLVTRLYRLPCGGRRRFAVELELRGTSRRYDAFVSLPQIEGRCHIVK
jgi:hypothetical protein